jgi:hypothetical protein
LANEFNRLANGSDRFLRDAVHSKVKTVTRHYSSSSSNSIAKLAAAVDAPSGETYECFGALGKLGQFIEPVRREICHAYPWYPVNPEACILFS